MTPIVIAELQVLPQFAGVCAGTPYFVIGELAFGPVCISDAPDGVGIEISPVRGLVSSTAGGDSVVASVLGCPIPIM